MDEMVPLPEPGDRWEFVFADKREVFVHGRVTSGRGVVFVVAEYERNGDVFTMVLTQFHVSYRLKVAAPPKSDLSVVDL